MDDKMRKILFASVLLLLFISGCIGSPVKRCTDSSCAVEHIKEKGCDPLIYEYEGKILEIQGIVKDANGNNTCKVHLKWSDGTEMTCYTHTQSVGNAFIFIKMGFPMGNCSGSYIDTGCAGICPNYHT